MEVALCKKEKGNILLKNYQELIDKQLTIYYTKHSETNNVLSLGGEQAWRQRKKKHRQSLTVWTH
ncbi:hypothetical protein K010075C41_06970 [Sellimonas intestinalis]